MSKLTASVASLKVFCEWRLIAIALLGLSSGLPLALTMSTLSLWLAESGVNKATIGVLALVGLPYSFKFLWAPVIDHVSIPLLTRAIGRRKSWMLLTQALLGISIFMMGRFDPRLDVAALATLAVVVAFFSASQDVVVDAFRIEILDEKTYAPGAAIFIFGYRIGMIVSSAGALFLASFFSWDIVYALMALCISVGMITALLCKEPAKPKALESAPLHSLSARIKNMTIGPFIDFMTKPQWIIILIFVVFYKLGDAFLGNMVSPFYLDMGFSKIEIASVTKLFGLVATLLGGFAGALMVLRYGMLKALLVCGFFQLASNWIFALLAIAGHSVPFLAFTIGVENFTSAMGNAAFMAYLSSLCTLSFTASQYAMLSAVASFGRTFFSASAGWLAEATTWPMFFVLSSVVAIPGILALLWLMRLTLRQNAPLEPIRTT